VVNEAAYSRARQTLVTLQLAEREVRVFDGSDVQISGLSLKPPSARAVLALCQPGVVDRDYPATTSGDEKRRAASGPVYEAPDDLASQVAHTSRAMTS